jgi:16S rRNA (cytosine1402-N4)-methyltransferase
MAMDSPTNKSKRRPRYKGTHPRKFSEKYKELNPERYADEIAKLHAKGKTPAGSHRPICLNEILQILKPSPGQVVLDATLGHGGHSLELLKSITPGGKLIALDQDPIERPKTEKRLREFMTSLEIPQENLVVGGINFSAAMNFLRQNDLPQVDAVLADLGLSSMQIDTPERGFSFKIDAPFDLRMNPTRGVPASQILAEMSLKELTVVLSENADEPHAEQIASALKKQQPTTTTEVAACVRSVLKTLSSKVQAKEGDTPIRRVFQALRIVVNDEFATLDQLLEELPEFLKPGGRVAILTFHSGEDRRVKKSFQAGYRGGVYSEIAPEPLRPSMAEQNSNPRSKSAKLRWAIRV